MFQVSNVWVAGISLFTSSLSLAGGVEKKRFRLVGHLISNAVVSINPYEIWTWIHLFHETNHGWTQFCICVVTCILEVFCFSFQQARVYAYSRLSNNFGSPKKPFEQVKRPPVGGECSWDLLFMHWNDDFPTLENPEKTENSLENNKTCYENIVNTLENRLAILERKPSENPKKAAAGVSIFIGLCHCDRNHAKLLRKIEALRDSRAQTEKEWWSLFSSSCSHHPFSPWIL